VKPYSFIPYAQVEYDKSQVSISSFSGTTETPPWSSNVGTCKFDVTRAVWGSGAVGDGIVVWGCGVIVTRVLAV
jgi:hypothetical protein